MAHNSKKSPQQRAEQRARQESRAQRLAVKEAAQKAREEQLAKDRKQQTIIGVIVIVVVLALIAVAGVAVWRNTHQKVDAESSAAATMSVDEAYADLQKVSTKPSRVDDKGGILISKDGYGKSVADAPTIGIYMDFLCPGCGNLNRKLDSDLIKMMDAGQINLELHFMSFMDRYSTDDYSSRAANAALYIAEHDDDPNHLLEFMKNLYSEDFQPDEGSSYKSVSDDQLKEQAKKAGVSDEVANNAFNRNYQDWLDAINVYTPKREELWNTSGSLKGSMSTPTVTINGYFWNMNDLSTADLTIPEGFCEAIGLKQSDIGVAGKMPSIGATGKPIDVLTGE